MKTFKISKEEYGKDYPFIVSPVMIENKYNTKELYVWHGFKKYNLNGVAKKGLPLEQIWEDNPDIPGTNKSIGFIFRLCKDRGF